MSRKHPVIAVTGSSGAGTTTVKVAFEHIFRREGVNPAVIQGWHFPTDSHHRIALRRAECHAVMMLVKPQPHRSGAFVDAFFGVPAVLAQRRPEDWCVRYKYSARLSYTLLFREGVVQSVRLTEGHYTPQSCEGILVRSVEVQARDWYDSAPPPRKNRCGCPPWGASSCAVAAEQEDAPDEAPI